MKRDKFTRQFEALVQKSQDAVAMFEFQSKKLRENNEQLAEIHAEINAEIERLTNLKSEIAERIAQNEVAIKGFDNLIHGEI